MSSFPYPFNDLFTFPVLLRDVDSSHKSITPGPQEFHAQYDKAGIDVSSVQSIFPFYPTAFLMAANVVLELTGDTSDIEQTFNSSETNASVTASYGPFSISPSYNHSQSDSKCHCESTSTGCRITIEVSLRVDDTLFVMIDIMY